MYCILLLATIVSEPIVIAGGVVGSNIGVRRDVLGA